MRCGYVSRVKTDRENTRLQNTKTDTHRDTRTHKQTQPVPHRSRAAAAAAVEVVAGQRQLLSPRQSNVSRPERQETAG